MKINKKIFLSILIVPILSGFLFILIYILFYLFSFSHYSGLAKKQIIKEIASGLKNPYEGEYLTLLILGSDKREGGNGNSLLTDTILLAVINKNGNYLLFSLPRDLWINDFKTKINSLYYYGAKLNPDEPVNLLKEKIEQILNWRINYTLVLEMEDIKNLVDGVGGISVDVERSFIDEEFPKDDGSSATESVSFEKGGQIFDGERALQFMRSRKSKDEIEGTDSARQLRQKKVILALKDKLISEKSFWLNPENSAGLYIFLEKEIDAFPKINLKELFSFYEFKKLVKGSAKEIEMPWQEEDAILQSSRDFVHNTWILLPKDNNWDLIKDYFYENLP